MHFHTNSHAGCWHNEGLKRSLIFIELAIIVMLAKAGIQKKH